MLLVLNELKKSKQHNKIQLETRRYENSVAIILSFQVHFEVLYERLVGEKAKLWEVHKKSPSS